MIRSHYRTKHRSLILRTIKDQPLSVKLIHEKLSGLFNAGKLKHLPAIRQVYRTVSDLRESRLLVADRIVGAVCYYRRSY